MNDLDQFQLLVRVERHLTLEARLAGSMEDVNRASAGVFANAGLRGPSPQELATLKPMLDALQALSAEVGAGRQSILARINEVLGTEFTKIKQFIATLSGEDRDRLSQRRHQILDQAYQSQASLIHNQAVLFYTFDYHRKYLAGVLNSDTEPQNYRADGQPSSLNPGNFLGKTC